MFDFFFFNDTATTEIYTLSLHDALPIYPLEFAGLGQLLTPDEGAALPPLALATIHLGFAGLTIGIRSEEHTSELQSRQYLVCRLLLEKKKQKQSQTRPHQDHIHIRHPTQ